MPVGEVDGKDKTILGLIRNSPGGFVGTKRVANELDMSTNGASYRLKQLEKDGHVKSKQLSRDKAWYLPEMERKLDEIIGGGGGPPPVSRDPVDDTPDTLSTTGAQDPISDTGVFGELRNLLTKPHLFPDEPATSVERIARLDVWVWKSWAVVVFILFSMGVPMLVFGSDQFVATVTPLGAVALFYLLSTVSIVAFILHTAVLIAGWVVKVEDENAGTPAEAGQNGV